VTVVLAAHGSPDPRHRKVVGRIRDAAALHLGDVRIGWLGHHRPSLRGVVDRAATQRDPVTVVPLLLAPAFHATTDVPSGARSARIAPVLAPDDLLLDVLDQRVADALGAGDHMVVPDALVLVAAGTTDPAGAALVREVAAEWASRNRLPVAVAHITGKPGLVDAVGLLRANGARGLAVGSFLLAPGQLHDRALAQAAELGVTCVADPLADHPDLVRVVVERARAAGVLVPG
jgi:sirohydrochlorin ferrochelatase